MNTPDSSGWRTRTHAGIDASTSGGLDTRNETQRGSIASPPSNRSRSGTEPGARRSPRDQRPQLALDHQLREVLVGQALGAGPARVDRGGEGGQELLVEEVGERPVADVVEEARDPQRLDDQPLGRDRLAGRDRRQRGPQARVQRARPEPRLVHHAQAVGEPRMLGGGEDPARALELADPSQPLDPRRVEEVVLGDVLGVEVRGARLVRGEALRQLDVPVDRVADEVDGGEREAASPPVGRRGGLVPYGTQTRPSVVHSERLPRWSAARTRKPYQCPRDRSLQRERCRGSCCSGPSASRRGRRGTWTSKLARPASVGLERPIVAGPVERDASGRSRPCRASRPWAPCGPSSRRTRPRPRWCRCSPGRRSRCRCSCSRG